MLPVKTPRAEVKRLYALHAQIGLAASILLVTAVFAVPFRPAQRADALTIQEELVTMEDVEVTRQTADLPPPAPLPPPPVEVPDAQEVEEAVLPAIELNLDASAPLPPAAAPPPPRAAPPPPPEPVREPEPEVFVVVEQMPELVGGIETIRPVYPDMELRAGLEGRVFVEFVVNEDGTVSDPRVLRGATAGFDEAALAAVRDLRFVPGQQRGRAVKVRMSIPITFRLTN